MWKGWIASQTVLDSYVTSNKTWEVYTGWIFYLLVASFCEAPLKEVPMNATRCLVCSICTGPLPSRLYLVLNLCCENRKGGWWVSAGCRPVSLGCKLTVRLRCFLPYHTICMRTSSAHLRCNGTPCSHHHSYVFYIKLYNSLRSTYLNSSQIVMLNLSHSCTNVQHKVSSVMYPSLRWCHVRWVVGVGLPKPLPSNACLHTEVIFLICFCMIKHNKSESPPGQQTQMKSIKKWYRY